MPYFGGKGRLGKGGAGDWIAGQVPWSRDSLYVEPFAGMLGILLRREPVALEIVNDLDGRIVNWWSVVRDHPEELAKKLRFTPYSRVEFERSIEPADDPVEDARRFTVMVLGSVHSGSTACKGDWFRQTMRNRAPSPATIDHRVVSLATRLREVQFENIDAVKLLVRIARHDNAVIYCDPPYKTATTKHYRESDFDKNAMVDALREQSGRVAVSGYNDEWDVLGWRCESRVSMRVQINGVREDRIEKLWMNYPPVQKQLLS